MMTSDARRPATSFGAMHLLSSASMLRESKTFFQGERMTYGVVSNGSSQCTRTASNFRRISGKRPVVVGSPVVGGSGGDLLLVLVVVTIVGC